MLNITSGRSVREYDAFNAFDARSSGGAKAPRANSHELLKRPCPSVSRVGVQTRWETHSFFFLWHAHRFQIRRTYERRWIAKLFSIYLEPEFAQLSLYRSFAVIDVQVQSVLSFNMDFPWKMTLLEISRKSWTFAIENKEIIHAKKILKEYRDSQYRLKIWAFLFSLFIFCVGFLETLFIMEIS